MRAGLLLVFSEVGDSSLPNVWALLGGACGVWFISLSVAASGGRGWSHSHSHEGQVPGEDGTFSPAPLEFGGSRLSQETCECKGVED